MSIRDYATKNEIEEAKNFVRMIKDGSIKKRTLPNTGEHFDEDRAYKSFKNICNNNVLKEAAEKIYE
ncbi:MAG: hypothetical protein ACOCWZ_09015 [Spirochaetota bacterium]